MYDGTDHPIGAVIAWGEVREFYHPKSMMAYARSIERANGNYSILTYKNVSTREFLGLQEGSE